MARTHVARFSLVELLMTMSIASVLATIALPHYVQCKWQAARSEMFTNVEGIRVAQASLDVIDSHFGDEQTYQPDDKPGRAKRPWLMGSAFDELQWWPDGDVYASYATFDDGIDYRVYAMTDLDGDGLPAGVFASQSVAATLVTAVEVF
jgi:prepilin-type N-terminal cleavage/methylation domain-containing protein